MRKYQITNNEVTKIEGIITKKEISIPHINIVDIKVVKGVIGRIFDFGDITVRGVKDEINMKGMRDPEVIYRIIKNKITLIGKPKVKVKKEKKKK